MGRRYGLWGERTRDFLTQGGRILVHDNPAELEFLFLGARVREVPPSIPADQCLPLPHAVGMETVRFPLDRRQFRNPNR